MKVQNFIESLCIVYLMYHWSLCTQTRCTELLLIITKPTTTKWAYTDSSTLICSITRHTTERGVGGRGGGILPRKATNLVFCLFFYRYVSVKFKFIVRFSFLFAKANKQGGVLGVEGGGGGGTPWSNMTQFVRQSQLVARRIPIFVT